MVSISVIRTPRFDCYNLIRKISITFNHDIEIGAWKLRDCQLWVIRAKCVRAVRAARERLKTNRKPRKLFLILCVCAMEKLICVVVRPTMKNKHTSERASKRDRMVKNKSHIKWPHHCYCYSTYIHNAHTMQLVFFRQRKCAKWEYSFENNNSAKLLHCEKKCKFHWTCVLSSWK